MIWFSGSGTPNTVWCALCDDEEEGEERARNIEIVTCNHELCTELRALESRGKYKTYVMFEREARECHSYQSFENHAKTRLSSARI